MSAANLSTPAISEHQYRSARHCTTYLRCGPADGPLIVLIHGWPERAISWRHQLSALAAAGYLVVAPDMRGYGTSSQYSLHDDYTVEHAVTDMLELIDGLGRRDAVWIGHDWGSPVVWALASHHPERCRAVANLCVPYQPGGFTLDSLLPLVDRTLYPADKFPAGQWEYFLLYREQFARASACFEADVGSTVRALFRRGIPDAQLKPSRLAFARIDNGWFGGQGRAPDVPVDSSVLDPESYAVYVEGLTRNGFFGPGSWYVNDAANAAFAQRALNGGRLRLPVLFLHARYDSVCETIRSRLADPMRAHCKNLTEVSVDSGHWMAQEQPDTVNRVLLEWITRLG